jgi:glycosyltransferase involved in cell wall biosynthesis
MRIAIIAPPWVPTPPQAYGGIEAVVDRLATGLQSHGHEVFLFATGDSTSQVPLGYRFENALGVGREDATIVELVQVMSAYDMVREFDIVHDHTHVGPAYSARFPDLPVVTTNHIPFGDGVDSYYRAIGDRVPVIAISNAQARSARGVNIVDVIHHGVDPAEFAIGEGKGGYALFLGRMSPDKGVHTAIEVARAAGIPLKIAAKCREGKEISYYEEVIKPKLGGGIEYLGEATFEEKVELLGGAACLLNPIDWQEPFGMVMIEAMACGTPVVATHAGAAPEIVVDGETGFLADSAEELVKAVQKVSGLDRRKCRTRVEESFSKELMVEKHLDVYEKVVANFGQPFTASEVAPDRFCEPCDAKVAKSNDVMADDFMNFRSASGL